MHGETDLLRQRLRAAVLRRRVPVWLGVLLPLLAGLLLWPDARNGMLGASVIAVLWLLFDARRWQQRIGNQWATWLNAAVPALEDSSELLAVDAANQITLANQVIAKRLSVRETEKLVARSIEEQASPAAAARAKDKPGDIVRLEEELSDKLATPVMFKMGTKGKGQLIIDFADLDILDGVLARLRA